MQRLFPQKTQPHLIDNQTKRATMGDEDKVQRMYQTAIDHLQQNGFRFGRVDDDQTLLFFMSGRNGTYSCVLGVQDAVFRVLTTIGCRAPAEKRVATAELLNRINWILTIGNFEMNHADGGICFRTVLDCRGGELTDEMVEMTVRMNIVTVDRFHPAIMTLLWNDLAPEDALALVETAPT